MRPEEVVCCCWMSCAPDVEIIGNYRLTEEMGHDCSIKHNKFPSPSVDQAEGTKRRKQSLK